MLKAQGNLPEALKSYQAGFAIDERLAQADPSNTQSQNDLAWSYNKLGDVLSAQENYPEALKSYQAGFLHFRTPRPDRPHQRQMAEGSGLQQ